MLGRYCVERELGRGATGSVYLGRDAGRGRLAAIKTMALTPACDADELKQARQRFMREAETAWRLVHPNIVTIYDAGEAHGLAYIAMEFLGGRDLVPYTKPGDLLPLPRALSIVARVAEALAYAHRNGVVHRDIKPANILYDPANDTVKVTDFGIARVAGAANGSAGIVAGTPFYMAPEQLAGRKSGGRSDLFSLGVTLYQLASGELPFRGDSMAGVLHRITNEPHADIRAYQPSLPARVVAIIDKALAKNPGERYRNAGAMAQALRRCLGTMGAATGRG
jgi:serine/threonine-protein kinase